MHLEDRPRSIAKGAGFGVTYMPMAELKMAGEMLTSSRHRPVEHVGDPGYVVPHGSNRDITCWT